MQNARRQCCQQNRVTQFLFWQRYRLTRGHLRHLINDQLSLGTIIRLYNYIFGGYIGGYMELFEYPVPPHRTKHIWTVKTANQLEKPRFVILAFQSIRKNKNDEDCSNSTSKV